MSGYNNGSTSGSKAAVAVIAVILITVLLIGGLALGGSLFLRIRYKQALIHEFAARGKEAALRQQVEAATAEAERLSDQLAAAEQARREAEALRQEVERLKAELAETQQTKRPADADSAETPSADAEFYLDTEGHVYVDQEPKDWDQLGELLDELAKAARGRVVIVADQECRMEPVLRLMQLAKRRDLSVTVSARELQEARSP